jgi:hypothetical protein
VLGEDEYGEADEGQVDVNFVRPVRDQEERKGWWLESDDIEEE